MDSWGKFLPIHQPFPLSQFTAKKVFLCFFRRIIRKFFGSQFQKMQTSTCLRLSALRRHKRLDKPWTRILELKQNTVRNWNKILLNGSIVCLIEFKIEDGKRYVYWLSFSVDCWTHLVYQKVTKLNSFCLIQSESSNISVILVVIAACHSQIM